MRISLTLLDGVISEAGYRAYGCPATLGCAQELTERVRGLPLLDAAAISEADLMASVPAAAERADSAALAIDALHQALSQALHLRGAAGRQAGGASDTGAPLGGAGAVQPASSEGAVLDPRGVVVGMSGGVDSGVAALLLRDQGYRVVGVTLELWSDPGTPGERTCCSPDAVRRARRVAHSLGLPHLTVDARDVFAQQVVCYFVEGYRGGTTPNPCAKCNARVRFGGMLALARSLGLSWVATGHYARLVEEPRRLARGLDGTKDQSYVLAEVDPAVLAHVLFPLGEMDKPAVRRLAAEAGLEGHQAPESQEICFIADDDHRRFLRERLGEMPGEIVDSRGAVIGRHTGTYNFTIGQRKGLGIAAPEPLFVTSLDAATGRVVAGPAAALEVCEVVAEGLTWHRPAPDGGLQVQLRSSGATFPVRMAVPGASAGPAPAGGSCGPGEEPALQLVLERPAGGVAAGQTAVVYQGDRVIVAGTIVRTVPCSRGGSPEGGEQ